MAERKIKLAFIGLGGMGQAAHLRNYLLMADVEVVAAAEIRPGLRQEVADRAGIPHSYRDHQELLAAEPDLDGIVAIQLFEFHGGLIPALAGRRLPILTEKPIARSVLAGEKILGAVQAAGAPLFVAYHKRSDPAVMHAKELIEKWKASGEFGRLKYVRLTMPPGPWPGPGFDATVRSAEPYPALVADEAESGLGEARVKRFETFVNYYIHQVNLMRHLLGEDYIVNHADPAGVVLAIRSASNVSGIIEMAPYHSSAEWQEQAFIGFEKAWIRIELPAPLSLDQAGRLTIYRDAGNGTGETTEPVLPARHAMRQQALNFVQAIRGEVTPLCRADDALKDLQVARSYLDLFDRHAR